MTTDDLLNWEAWLKLAPKGQAESIYYILAVPITWAGPAPGSHRYSGLHFKIGRSKNVMARVRDLRTGTSDDLIIHAMEPGDSTLESKLHKQFIEERRQGEWFAASPALSKHVMQVFQKNRVLPPEHQQKLLSFMEKSQLFGELRKRFNFDRVNPSINEDWGNCTLVDLTNPNLIDPKEWE